MIHCRSRCNPQPMAVQTPLAKKVTGSQNSYYGFLSLFGNHRELKLALLDVEDRVLAGSP